MNLRDSSVQQDGPPASSASPQWFSAVGSVVDCTASFFLKPWSSLRPTRNRVPQSQKVKVIDIVWDLVSAWQLCRWLLLRQDEQASPSVQTHTPLDPCGVLGPWFNNYTTGVLYADWTQVLTECTLEWRVSHCTSQSPIRVVWHTC
jgi:hypothetical protein